MDRVLHRVEQLPGVEPPNLVAGPIDLEDVVTEELQRGYHLNGRVLRHAMVKVSMGPGPSEGESTAESTTDQDQSQTEQG